MAATISKNLPETTTIRDIALLSDAVARIHGIVRFHCTEVHIRVCQLDGTSLTSEAAECLVLQTVQESVHVQAAKGDQDPKKIRTPGGQCFFYKDDTSEPM
jgi:hypothetical protein